MTETFLAMKSVAENGLDFARGSGFSFLTRSESNYWRQNPPAAHADKFALGNRGETLTQNA